MSNIIHKGTSINDMEIYLICKKMENLLLSGILSLIPEPEYDPMGGTFSNYKEEARPEEKENKDGRLDRGA